MPHVDTTYLSLFAGVAGLDLGFEAAIEYITGARPRCVGYVEWEAYAASIILARMESQALELAPVFCGDIRELDGRELRGRADWVIGGFPCQDVSTAGKGGGVSDGARSGLWFDYARLLGEIRPAGALIENVAALRLPGRGLDRVIIELAALGYNAQWLHLRASDVGAPHQRDRIFIFAWDPAQVDRLTGMEHPDQQRWQENGGLRPAAVAGPGSGCPEVADTGCQPDERWREPGELCGARAQEQGQAPQQRDGHTAGHVCEDMADTAGARSDGTRADPDGAAPEPHGPEQRSEHVANAAGERSNERQRQRASAATNGNDSGSAQRAAQGPNPGLKTVAQNWPSPRAEDSESAGNHPGSTDSLTGAMKHWQTPGTDSFRSRGHDRKDEMGLDQQARATQWPTPRASEWKESGPEGSESHQHMLDRKYLGATALSFRFFRPVPVIGSSGQPLSPTKRASALRPRLNPAFVCWLMGWPWWWTNPGQISFAVQAMALYRSRLLWHLSDLCGARG